MLELNANSISDYISASFDLPQERRNSELMVRLVQCLHEYIRETRLTHSEWRTLLQFLHDVGNKTTPARDEFMLISDVMGVTSLVDIIAEEDSPHVTAASPQGPYYLPDAPVVEQGGFICREHEPGVPVIIKGSVTDTDGCAIEGALLDIWHNADSRLYSNEDESQDDMNNRGRIYTDARGEFRVKTIRPQPYTIPMDGPVGSLMQAFQRSPWRSAHFHVIASANGHQAVTTELFFGDCEYIDKDAVAALRSNLVHEPVYQESERGKTLIVDHHFCLQKT